MPLLGWSLGAVFADWFDKIDHWVAFALLALLGARMIRAGLWGGAAEETPEEPTRGAHIAGLSAAALATSVDAAAAGLTLRLFATPAWLSCLVIGAVTFALCTAGHWFAARAGPRLGRHAEVAGGVVLIVLGFQILVEHMR